MRTGGRSLKRKSSSLRVTSPLVSPPRLRSPAGESGSRLRSPSFRDESSPKRVRRTSSRLSNHSLTSPIPPSPQETPKRRRKSVVADDFQEMVDEEEESPVKEKKQKRKRRSKKKVEEEEEETPARRTRIDDPNAPKRGKNAYLHYVSARRQALAKENGSDKVLNSTLADDWKVMTEEERQPYLDLAAKDKAAYDERVAEYQQTELYAEFQASKKIRMKERKSLPNEEGMAKSPKIRRKSENGEEHPVEDPELASLRKEQAAMKEEIKKLRRETEILHNRIKTGRRTKEILHEVKPINVEIQRLEKKNKTLKKSIKADKERIGHIDNTMGKWLEILKKAVLEAKIENSDDDLSSPETASRFVEGLSPSDLTSLRHAIKAVCKEHGSE